MSMLDVLRSWAIRIVWDGPRMPAWLANRLFDFGMGQKGRLKPYLVKDNKKGK